MIADAPRTKKQDWYAFGMVVTEMLLGEQPEGTHALRLQQVERAAALAPSLANLVRTCTAGDPAARRAWTSAEVYEELKPVIATSRHDAMLANFTCRGNGGYVVDVLEHISYVKVSSEEYKDHADMIAASYDLQHASDVMKADREYVKPFIVRNGNQLRHVSAELRADAEFVVPFLVQDRQLLCYASDDLRADPEVAVHGSLEHAAEALKSDLDFVIRRCATYPHDIKFASYGLRLDFDNALDIVSRAGMTLGDVLYKTSQFSEAQYKQLVLTAARGTLSDLCLPLVSHFPCWGQLWFCNCMYLPVGLHVNKSFLTLLLV